MSKPQALVRARSLLILKILDLEPHWLGNFAASPPDVE